MDTHTAWPDLETTSPACKAEFYRQMDALESFAQANKLAAAAAIAADGSLADAGARAAEVPGLPERDPGDPAPRPQPEPRAARAEARDHLPDRDGPDLAGENRA